MLVELLILFLKDVPAIFDLLYLGFSRFGEGSLVVVNVL